MNVLRDPGVATIGGGCFWCIEAAMLLGIKGLTKAIPGYAGGPNPNPTYKQVCTGTTGHAEVVQLTYDPSEETFDKILNLFFTFHDPTQLNRQGADVGTQYRSVIFYHSESQRQAASTKINSLGSKFVNPIVTQLLPAPEFWPAEEYHHSYFARNPDQAYCSGVIAPKLKKLGLQKN